MIGGIESHLCTLAEAVAARGHRVSVVVCQPHGQNLAKSETRNGVDIFRVKRHFDIASSAFSFGLVPIVRQLKPDVIHLQMPWPGGDLALLALQIPYVVTYQSDIVRQQFLLNLYTPMLHRTLQHSRAIIATSPQYLASSSMLQAYAAKCVVIPLGIVPPPAAIPERVAFWRQRFPQSCALWVGRMRYYKGLIPLIHAMCHVPDSLQLALVGVGPQYEEIANLATSLGVAERVHFLGTVSDEDVRALQAIATFFVFPSHLRSEAFGLALLEALATGLPAITCEIGTGTSYVNAHLHTGLVVPSNDVAALADAMTTLWQDASVRREYAQNATTWASTTFSVTQMVDNTLALYQSVL